MMLSRHISREAFEHSDIAVDNNIPNRMNPRQVKIARQFCLEVLDPVIDHLGFSPYRLACFRSLALMRFKKWGLGSHHAMRGPYAAADIEFEGISNWALATLMGVILPRYDQIILELHDRDGDPNSGWCHIGWKQKPGRNRRQLLTYKGGGLYVPGHH